MTLHRSIKVALWMVVPIIFIVVFALSAVWWVLSGSQAQLTGTVIATDLSDSTFIKRDEQGIVTITGQTRSDIGYALGYVHAQERFFQMDLLRRNSAGELSELFGTVAANFDKKIRTHQFRQRAEKAIEVLPAAHQNLISAYTQGVNAGLANLKSKSFEYHLLQTTPEDWVAADSFLVVFSMYLDLQNEWAEGERSLTAMHDLLPKDWFQFLDATGGEWDAPLDGTETNGDTPLPTQPLSSFQPKQSALNSAAQTYRDRIEIGSNNWSVGGRLTNHGGALIANDMHLGLDVPNIWFRASWILPESGRQITGATLPGTPLMIIGSTGSIAWGFTNSYGDYIDAIRLQTNAEATEYLTPEGWKAFEVSEEVINVKGEPAQTSLVKKTIWGPVVGEDHFGNLLAIRWVAHDLAGLNLGLVELETANSVNDAITIAAQTGIPGQNFNVGDADGNLGWTIMGVLPERFGYDSNLSKRMTADWSNGKMGWKGHLSANEYPVVYNPEANRIWTGNARIVGGESYAKMGDGMGALGARQQQIRDRLNERDEFNEAQFLEIQLDDEALFLSRWQTLLLETLSEATLTESPDLTEFAQHVDDWQGHASSSSVGYLLVKRFRETVIDQTAGHIYRYVENQSSDFWMGYIDNKAEYPVWQLLTTRPKQHIPAPFKSWDSFLISSIQKLNAQLSESDTGLAEQTWGRANTLSITHPLSSAIPFLSTFLDMESEPMSGDTYMPRVQGSDFGASQRMALSPGHEESGYFHMATGQSAHPLSPFFGYGHEDWVTGLASPFLPGETKFTLELSPSN